MIEQTQLNTSAISREVRSVRRRSFAGPEIKLLIGMLSVVATLAFWSLFSNRDRVLALASQVSQANANQANTQVVLAPLPAAPVQPLRFVTAPAASSNTSVKAPPPVTISRNSNRTRVAPVTTTSSSRP